MSCCMVNLPASASAACGCVCACSACPASSASPLLQAAARHPSSLDSFDDPLDLFRRIATDKPRVKSLAAECINYAMANGLTMARHAKPKPKSKSAQLTATVGGAASASSVASATDALESEEDEEPPVIMHAPVTLLPHRLPARVFHRLRSLALELNTLYEIASRDEAWLRSVLRESALSDPFLRRLLQVLEETSSALGPRQSLHLAINRSDYLMHAETEAEAEARTREDGESGSTLRLRPLQVEFNTISCGAGSLSDKASSMHRFLLDRYSSTTSPPLRLDLPSNSVIENITSAMAHAHRLFLEQQIVSLAPAIPNTCVLFIIQEREANISDQRLLEYALWRDHSIPVVRMTLGEVHSFASIDEHNRLILRPGSAASANEQLVSLAYFRAGYTPRDFPTSVVDGIESEGDSPEWSALSLIERSTAIKCPRLSYHLAGTKKVQQVLAQPGVIERLLSSNGCTDPAGVSNRIHRVFAGLWSPSPESVERALASPDDFVLKPQREGGGNNLWGEEMINMLQQTSMEDLQAFVLMSRIRTDRTSEGGEEEGSSLESRPALKFGSVAFVQRALSEIGMMGCMLSQLEAASAPPSACAVACAEACGLSLPPTRKQRLTIHRNEYLGYLVRTKDASLNEGGLMSGAGAIDSLVLVP